MERGAGRGMLWLVLNTSDIGRDATCHTKELSSAVYLVMTLDTSEGTHLVAALDPVQSSSTNPAFPSVSPGSYDPEWWCHRTETAGRS